MQTKSILAAGAVLAFGLTACGANGTSPPPPPTVVNVASNVLQFAVGTANYAGVHGNLNVVVTYRQPKGGTAPGDSGTQVNSPTLTIPGTLPAVASVTGALGVDPYSMIQYGPSTLEVSGKSVTSNSQAAGSSSPAGTNNQTSFGLSGGAFGLGLEPFNVVGTGDFAVDSNVGTPFSYVPYNVPLYDAAATKTTTAPNGTDPNAFTPWGGPPAFNPAGNGQSIVGNASYQAGVAGVSEGIDVFEGVNPVAGPYQLTVAVPTSTGTKSVTATASIAAPAYLPNVVAPTYVPDGSGGGSLTGFVMPAGATEAYIQVTDYGAASAATPGAGCNGGTIAQPIFYTIEVTASGSVTLPDTAGPGGTPSICTAAENAAVAAGTPGDSFAVQAVAFDYPAFQIDYPNSSGNPAPAIATGTTDDITISAAACGQDAGGGAITACPATGNGSLPLIKSRKATAATVRANSNVTRLLHLAPPSR